MKKLFLQRWVILAIVLSFLSGCLSTSPKPDRSTQTAESQNVTQIPADSVVTEVSPDEAGTDSEQTGSRQDGSTISEGKRIDSGKVLFATLRSRFSQPACVDDTHNKQWRKRYAGYPRSFSNHLEQILPLFGYVTEEVVKRDLPVEFALIPIIESWYRPEARGPGGPAGMWQIMSPTAAHLGIRVDKSYDGRLSPVDSTKAALDYLHTMKTNFGDWRTAAMGYNAGEFRVRRAMEKDGSKPGAASDRKPAGLSEITYAYIAKIRALACLIAEPKRQNLSLPMRAFAPLQEVRLTSSSRTLASVARQYGSGVADIRKLNPAYRDNRIPSNAPGKLLVPTRLSDADRLAAQTDDLPESAETAAIEDTQATATQPYTVRRGDSLWLIARKHGTSIAALRRINDSARLTRLRPGQNLQVPASTQSTESRNETVAQTEIATENKSSSSQASVDAAVDTNAQRTHRVSQGENLWTIARRYRVKLQSLMQINSLSKTAVLKPGQLLQLPE